MKKFNSLLARFMLVLLALHGLMGAFTLLRMTTFNWKPLSYTLLAALLLHGILGILLSKVTSRLSVSFHKSFSSPPFLFIFCAPRNPG